MCLMSRISVVYKNSRKVGVGRQSFPFEMAQPARCKTSARAASFFFGILGFRKRIGGGFKYFYLHP